MCNLLVSGWEGHLASTSCTDVWGVGWLVSSSSRWAQTLIWFQGATEALGLMFHLGISSYCWPLPRFWRGAWVLLGWECHSLWSPDLQQLNKWSSALAGDKIVKYDLSPRPSLELAALLCCSAFSGGWCSLCCYLPLNSPSARFSCRKDLTSIH